MPNTGVTRKYKFSVNYGVIAPDGVQKNGILINGQFPGPLIEANWGDWIEVEVTNDFPEKSGDHGEPTALHWHGLLQHETPYYDGVPSVQQCPIVPKKSLTYRFRADQFGSSWYHSHYSAQYAGGAAGPIVIHGPTHVCYDEDVGPIVLSDHYHKDYFTMLRQAMNGSTPLSNNILINGKNNFPCDNTTLACTPNAGVSKFRFTPGKKYRLRLINTSADAFIKYTIDGHVFTIFANDFKPVVPYTAQVVSLAVGQRTDVVVEAIGTAGSSYWMRAEMGNSPARDGCSFSDGVSTMAVAAVYYTGADENSVPTSANGLTVAQKQTCGNDPLPNTSAFCPVPIDPDFELVNLDFNFVNNGTNFVWTVNNSTFRANMNINLLDHVQQGNTTFDPQWNVYSFTPTKKAVRIHMRNFWQAAHPMHLHGHDFNVLATGFGAWNGAVVNPAKSLVRDTFGIPPFRPSTDGGVTPGVASYTVIQYNQDNPGIWPFHCHIAWHVSQGLYINIVEKPAEITYRIPQSIKNTCRDYNEWTKTNVPLQIDSGL
jgi:FtsP/CotA-like multicopper oxidase with cupredoxin domain